GAQRAGTTWWYRLIKTHPQVEAASKELHYFDAFWLSGEAHPHPYSDYFPRPPGKVAGEWTPRYMADHWTPPLLATAAPRARLLVSLRDPVDRYVSGLGLRATATSKPRRANAASDGSGGPFANRPVTVSLYRSLYGAQMRHLRRHFPAAQIMVLQFERCVLDPRTELRRTYEFLGLDPNWHPRGIKRVVNATRARVDVPEDDRRAVAAFLEDDVRQLA